MKIARGVDCTRRLLLAVLLVLTALPAQAVPVAPPEADRLLWCGNAFYWLGIDASDAGNDREADEYQCLVGSAASTAPATLAWLPRASTPPAPTT